MKRFNYRIFLFCMMFPIIVLYDGSVFAQKLDFGQYHALLIANQNYKYWKNLKTPYNDVDKLSTIFSTKYGFRIKVLKDATRDQIVDELEGYRRQLTIRDNLLIYYAGHGKLRKDGGYWIGVDAQLQSRSRWLNYLEISDLIDTKNEMKARHVLVIADSCYSGTLMRDGDALTKRRDSETEQAWIQRMAEKLSRTALTSGGKEPVIDNTGTDRNSIFARELINRLKNNTSILETKSLYSLIKKDVHDRARRIMGSDAQAPQYDFIPGTGHDGGDFIFVPKGIVFDVVLSESERNIKSYWGIKGDPTADLFMTNYLGMKFVYISPGTFIMGSPKTEIKRGNEPQRKVTLTRGFYMQSTEVTQDQWQKVMGSNPSFFKKCGGECPVEQVSWEDIQEFIKKLNNKEGTTGYHLPTEAEWEYAARAGSRTAFSNGRITETGYGYDPSLDDMGWYRYNSKVAYGGCYDFALMNRSNKAGPYCHGTHQVAQKHPNNWGLYDIHGNVWEMCVDNFCEHCEFNEVVDPKFIADTDLRVQKGGAWDSTTSACRAASRASNATDRDPRSGFRLVFSHNK